MTTFRPTGPAAVLGLCIALGPSLAGYFVYQGILEAKLSDRYVTAKGLVERLEKSDRGIMTISFKISGNDLNQLYQKLSDESTLIKTFMVQNGFTENEISVASPRVTDLHAREYNSGPLSPERYLIEHSLYVTSKNVDGLNALSAKTGELIRQGVTISQSNVQYYLDKFNDLRPQLVVEATKNALQVAEGFAKTTGSKIGGIRKANQGVISLTSPNASPNENYDGGLSSLTKKIRVVTTMEFYLN